MPTPADDLAQLLAAVRAYRPQPWAALSAPSPPPPAQGSGGGAVLEVLAGMGCLTRWGGAAWAARVPPPWPLWG
jgi:hypothetical protein